MDEMAAIVTSAPVNKKEQLENHLKIQRKPVSESVQELLDFCAKNKEEDKLVAGFKNKEENKYKPVQEPCVLS